jgi:beta-glucanase (GH16 family)
LQAYADDAFEMRGGVLRIKAEKRELDGMDYTSGLIETDYMFSQAFGYFEIRAKLPKGQGYWPAFWLLQEEIFSHEIDVFEAHGHKPDTVYLSNHWTDQDGSPKFYTYEYTGPDFTAGFHTFGIEWTQEEIIWYVDGVERYRTGEGVPQEPMYVIVNLAVGGDWPGMPDETTPFPGVLLVDYVRIYTPRPGASGLPAPGVQYMSFLSWQDKQ